MGTNPLQGGSQTGAALWLLGRVVKEKFGWEKKEIPGFNQTGDFN
jgi:hypothetical protein